ncbi:ankyrin repeat-containing domain protein [Fusarium oxysporum f. sp. albedinis]|nr:ankyrin repeat-containing domain protein [Fusarium oxysporum f. sp. albedinis]
MLDPFTILATINTLTSILVELNKLRERYANAGARLDLIQHDCDQIRTILHHFSDLLAQRHRLVPASDDGISLARLEELLINNCDKLKGDADKLHRQLRKMSKPENRGEHLMNHVKLLVKLRPLQQSHDAIKERLKEFQHQKLSWDSGNILFLMRRASEPKAPHSQLEEPRTACTRTTSFSAFSAPPVLNSRIHESRLQSLFVAIRTGNLEDVQRTLEYSDIQLNDPSTFEQNLPGILVAVTTGRIKMVELLLQHNADISLKNPEGQSALHIASLSRADDMVDFLLEKGANPQISDNYGRTPLWYAAYGKCSDRAFNALLHVHKPTGISESSGESDDKMPTPLWAAAAGGLLGRASALLNHGDDVSVRDKNGRILLHRTEWATSAALTELLLKHGADPWTKDNLGKRLPLHRAAEQGRLDICVQLLEAMIQLETRSRAEAVNVQDRQGLTPLMCAALNGSLPLVVYLAKVWNADVTLQDIHGNDAFYCACAKGHDPVAVFLLGSGASINRGNLDGNTPLHIAATHGHEKTVRLLLSLGASVTSKSRTVQSTWTQSDAQGLVTPGEAALFAGYDNISHLINTFELDSQFINWTF